MRTFMTKRQFVPSLRIDDPERTRVRVAPLRSAASAPLVEPSPDEPADLYYPRKARGLGYRHFSTLSEALDYVRGALNPIQRGGSVIQVGERRLEASDVARLLNLTKPAKAAS